MIFSMEQVGGSLCKLKIYFYSQNQAWVDIEPQVGYVSELDQIRFLGLYLAKIPYHFGNTDIIKSLIFHMSSYIQLIAENTNDLEDIPRLDILDEGQSLAKLDDHPSKIYRSQLYGLNAIDREIDTNYPQGAEEFFVPQSAIFFLQYLILHLSNHGLYTLLVYLKHLFDYFLLTGDYTRLQSRRESDLYALNSLIASLGSPETIMDPM